MDKLMLVTGDATFPRLLKAAIEDLGLEGFHAVASSAQARELLGQSQWDVAIVDLGTIPREDVPLLTQVSLDTIPPGLIALAGQGEEGAVLEALGHVVQAVLPRALPLPVALVRAVSSLVARRQAVQRTVDALMRIKMHATAIANVPSLHPASRTHSSAIIEEIEKLRDAVTSDYNQGMRPPGAPAISLTTPHSTSGTPAPAPTPAADATGAPGPKAKVLVVDDSKMTLAVIRSRMEAAGFQVITSTDSKGCGLLAVKERPDLILLDVMMPGLRGDLQAQLISGDRDLRKRAILLLHSDLPDETLKEMVYRSGADGYIHKNVEPAAFIAEIQEWLTELQTRRASQT